MGVTGRAGVTALARGAIAMIALAAGTVLGADATPASDAPAAAAATGSPAKGAATRPLRPPPHLKEGTLVIFNRPIVTFRASFIGDSPMQRAENARERINALLARNVAGKVPSRRSRRVPSSRSTARSCSS